MRNLTAALAAVAALSASSAALAQGNDAQFRSTTLTLSAQGEVRTAPDVATLIVGVLREEATAQAATATAGRALSAVTKALAASGVAPRDVQTQSIRLTPRFSNTANQAREIVAYQSIGGVTVRLRDLTRAGALIDAAVAAGANQINGPTFSVENRPTLERQARDQALRALNEEAARVADVMGQRVVRLVTVNTQAYVVAPLIERSVVMGAAPAPPPPLPIPAVQGIDPGEISIRANANGSFELAPK
jgi:uncharacterized protein YggE